ncbi:PD-(D/E)XK nuclease-like domain-containing protein [Subtercola endophyticus]|uniref:PD-(D/E)XK nuclease-like domain-containing protein n=1 Tax=Subtercola endophyticus TaxID=2895559 RepID=UPI001E39B4D4|nr:PD-(D/E)XK nuclease-like domain-containing protein [Subtercola endophyticus]UFS59501.1 PD-(D/E)XK nuclease-like domain-containing protein [Subtercola endophyticus]
MSDTLALVTDMNEATYHARPELSSTQARQILDSPARFEYARTHPQAPKKAFDLGSAVHSKVLGVGYGIEVLNFESWRSKDAQIARDETYAAGLIPMLPHELGPVDEMSEAILSHKTARQIFEQDGIAEASVFATDPTTGVPLRARFDWFAPVCADLKTTAKDASKDTFAKTVASFGYDTQRGHYLDTLRFATGETRELVFVVVETNPPHLVAVHQLDRIFADMGHLKARRAREIYAECTESGVWPGYPDEVQLVIPPTWLVYQDAEKYE